MNATATTVESPSIFRQELEHVKADMQRLRRDLSELWGDSVHTARSGAAEARGRLNDRTRFIAAKGRESVQAVEHQVAAHPLASLGAALAAGVVIGLVLRRRD
ncbi:MAG: hypothetical protein LW650_04860 [Planctomycetaceae bacterium]|jgi:ElaB/YqjD/DUF883 family membrane-anchored ribosome-binding protein|nr:DUF883 family protein [Phycisphaerales bacterium]MCE2652837.1 hypothetical protein [Planctomycetaceae bacterium]